MVPREYIPGRLKRVSKITLKAGVLTGYPLVDVKVTLHFGSYHEVDSNENAFKMAASMAFKEGMRKADSGSSSSRSWLLKSKRGRKDSRANGHGRPFFFPRR